MIPRNMSEYLGQVQQLTEKLASRWITPIRDLRSSYRSQLVVLYGYMIQYLQPVRHFPPEAFLYVVNFALHDRYSVTAFNGFERREYDVGAVLEQMLIGMYCAISDLLATCF